MKKRKHGFVLLELLTVIAIIGILAAILLPSLSRARESGRRGSCLANLQQMGMVLRMYADENERYLPWSGGNNNALCMIALHGDYMTNPDSLRCPSDSNGGGWSEKDSPSEYIYKSTVLDGEHSPRSSYDYLGAYTDEALRYPHPSKPIQRIPLIWDLWSGIERDDKGAIVPRASVGWMNHIPGGGNILYMDGSVEFKHNDEWVSWNLPETIPNLAMANPAARTPHEQLGDFESEKPLAARRNGFPGANNRFGNALRNIRVKPVPAPKVLTPEEKAAQEAMLEKFMGQRKTYEPVAKEDLNMAQKSWRWIKRNVFYISG